MKKVFFFCLFLCFASFFCAGTPARNIEFGIGGEAGFANNYMDFKEFFSNETLQIDLNTLPLKGLHSVGIMDAGLFFNFNIKQFSFGFFSGMDGFFTGGLSGEVARLFSEGNVNMRNFNGEVVLGGSIFFDTGVKAATEFRGWKFGVAPSLYIPLFYMPKPLIRFGLDTTESLSVDMSIRMNVYTPFSLEEKETRDIFNAAGADLSLFVEYALLPVLDVGGIMSHIPIVPSRLAYGMHIVSDFVFPQDTGEDIDESFIDALIKDKIPETQGKVFYLDEDFLRVYRPLRFDTFVRYKPFKNELITLTPTIGFSLLTIYGYDVICFNAELAGRLNLNNFFMIDLSTAYRERLWQHKLGLALNFRVVEVDLGAGLLSQDFVSSFHFKGLSVAFGLRFGY
ncbi:MAG: hypothetical protein LBD78_09750 [Spirochaetaceae bacterium]|jgi:hypothetical protein|nr:hypothetical protein [Spirochaetaceae bacterium]